jgi:DNA-binding ferritin-like protein (Dps family)
MSASSITAERLEAILADVLHRGDFEVVVRDGERELQPMVGPDVARFMAAMLGRVPTINLWAVARDMERELS